jgi:hypothetical protein
MICAEADPHVAKYATPRMMSKATARTSNQPVMLVVLRLSASLACVHAWHAQNCARAVSILGLGTEIKPTQQEPARLPRQPRSEPVGVEAYKHD